MAITAALVKELRDNTGAGMMDAKKALTETDGDMEAAVDWLRTKGLAKAAKKSGRTAAEGLIGTQVSNGVGVMVEVNSETDFVSKNSDFQQMVSSFATAALEASEVDGLVRLKVDGSVISEILTNKIATIGENMTIRRMARLEGESVATYVHNAVSEGMGKIGVLVAMTGTDKGIGKQIAMHIAAANPASLSVDDLDSSIIDREKQILSEQARESGKPEAVIEKMITGRMNKFFEEVTLLNQKFVINPDITVSQAAADAGVEVIGFSRLEVGEGIEKEQEDFAAEVAKTIGG
ncbi:MAG: translation elongation factor Ts [Rhodobacterales bacterium]|jgi:elongation factor Ts|tara:strand:- start:6568 stop:7443 length:876 start_codon:yes stop_codon:yes gene_type:complete